MRATRTGARLGISQRGTALAVESHERIVFYRHRLTATMRPLLAFFEYSLRAIVGSLVLAIVVLVSAQVLFRYAFASPIVWSEEFTTLCYQWLSYLGAALAVRYRGHFGVDFLSRLIPRSWRGAVTWIEHGVVWFIALFMIVSAVVMR